MNFSRIGSNQDCSSHAAILAGMKRTRSTLPVVGADTPANTDSLIQYPCQFPIKVMGLQRDGFAEAMTEVALRFDPTFDSAHVELRASSQGRYLGITLTVTATSRKQLDNLYRALTSHPMVKVVL